MTRYKHRPVEVEAVRWMGPVDSDEVRQMVTSTHQDVTVRLTSQQVLYIEGKYVGTRVGVGDWVVLENSQGLSVYPHATFIALFEVPPDEA